MELSNEYEKLLGIIDKEKSKSSDKTKPIESKPIIKKEEKKKETPKSVSQKKSVNLFDDFKALDINKDYSIPESKNKGSQNTEFNISLFKSLMKKKLLENYHKTKNYQRPYLSVTEIFTCFRKCYYERLNYKVDDGNLFNFAYLYLINQVGNTVHDVIQSLYNFDETEKVLKNEKYKVKGRVDAIKGSTVFEVKTVDPNEFPVKYRENDYNQGIIYSYILNNDYNYKINSLEIIYVSRTLKDMMINKYDIDFKKAEDFLKQSIYLHECLKTNSVPDTIFMTEEQCKFCQFKNFCKNEKRQPEFHKKINTFALGW